MARSPDPLIHASTLGRRRFLGVLGSGAAAVSLSACRAAAPADLVPYVTRPPELVPGKSRMYATGLVRDGYAVGVLGESRDGRPIKIEGNPRHPASLGGSGAWEQASVLSLYDDDRASTILWRHEARSWRDFAERFAPDSAEHWFTRERGAGLCLWLEPTSSGVTAHLLAELHERHPRMRAWFDPSSAPLARWEGARLAFGRVVETLFDFDRIDRVLSLDADFLTGMPMSLRWARDFSKLRTLERPEDTMSRLYAVEPSPTCTGITADHRLAVRPSEILAVAVGLLDALGEHGPLPEALAQAARRWRGRVPHAEWLKKVGDDLWAHRGRAAVVVGDRQPPEVHALGHALNALLGSAHETVHYVRSPILGAGTPAFDPAPLYGALDAGEVEALFTLEANPAYTAPPAHRFGERARRARVHVHAGAHRDETAAHAEWFLPLRHELERWDDARAQDGTRTPVQPLVRPLFGGRQVSQVLAALLGDPGAEPRALLGRAWNEDIALEEALGAGLVEGSAFAHERVDPAPGRIAERIAEPPAEPVDAALFELVLERDPRLLDGRFASNAWLQELPEPITKLVWGNAAILAPAEAEAMNVARGDLVRVKVGTASVRLPAWPQPGVAAGVLVAWLGHGRARGARVGRGVGADLRPLRGEGEWLVRGARLDPTGEHGELVSTQDHLEMEERPLVLRKTLEDFRHEPDFAQPHDEDHESIYPDRTPRGVAQWGMAIDLNKCTGCSACVIACQAENNVPAVGKAGVAMGREMHWLRIDRYHTHERGHERIDVQPMLCQHCEQAPCEYVCPVNATVHSPDGLNEMVYNRCVGTRFCSNNCPYKVRRFNWFDYHRDIRETEKMVMNPDVTVRARGVMEKCTYCVQRIRRAEIDAALEHRELRDEDVVTACQQACPSEAIVFGRVSDPRSRVSKQHGNPRAYAVLNELGTRPRTRYLARIVHRNPEIPEDP